MAELKGEWREDDVNEDVHACFLPVYSVSDTDRQPPRCIMDNGMFPRDSAFVLEAPILEGEGNRLTIAQTKTKLSNVFVNRNFSSGMTSLVTSPPVSHQTTETITAENRA